MDTSLHPAGDRLSYDVEAVRREFPILSREVHGRPLVYHGRSFGTHLPH